ncbi:unnamed protein product [Rotaria sordida]|uniref:Uncharacterized protein n=3 Tax=Rotaria sordida TaxID=392033 RepID=A0A815D7M5_9BILA|nr:unnamed protein product [Rotaria sordida]CAF1568841.1 unnamed protein product [Rotaria sordida]
MFCQDSQLVNKCYGYRYQWIILGYPSLSTWWNQPTDCSIQEIIHSPSEYITEYLKQFSKLEKDYFDGYVYDTIWSLAYLYQSHLLSNQSISGIFKNVIENIDFIDATVSQLDKETKQKQRIFINIVKFLGNGPSRDRTNQTIQFEHIYLSVFISISICCGIGLFISCTFIAFNIHFRSHRYIRMSSPTLDNIILGGLEKKMETINYYPSDTTIGSLLFNNYISEEIRCLTVKELTSSQAIDRLGAPVSDSPYDLALGPFDKKMIVVLLVIKGFVVCPWDLGHI